MKCQRCGADIPNGEVFCFSCGEEVQLVPDYNSIEYMMQQKRIMEEQALQEEKLKRQELLEKKQQEQKKKKKRILISVFLIIVAVAVMIGMISYIRYERDHSYEYQYGKAYEAYEEKNLTEAYTYAERAYELAPEVDHVILLTAEIRIESGKTEEGIQLLLSYVEQYPDDADAYAYLISLYEAQNRYDEIGQLMKNCTDAKLLEHFADYVPVEVQLLTKEGSYKKKITVELEFNQGTVYYTLDGTIPDQNSELYTEPILLEEGTTKFKAISYSQAGVPGTVIEAVYTVTLARPNAPFVSPESGEYDEDSKITVIVPEGCTAYYVFDSIATTSGTVYSEPVTMQKGEHIFSVIVVDENGKQSYPTSETYVVE